MFKKIMDFLKKLLEKEAFKKAVAFLKKLLPVREIVGKVKEYLKIKLVKTVKVTFRKPKDQTETYGEPIVTCRALLVVVNKYCISSTALVVQNRFLVPITALVVKSKDQEEKVSPNQEPKEVSSEKKKLSLAEKIGIFLKDSLIILALYCFFVVLACVVLWFIAWAIPYVIPFLFNFFLKHPNILLLCIIVVVVMFIRRY